MHWKALHKEPPLHIHTKERSPWKALLVPTFDKGATNGDQRLRYRPASCGVRAGGLTQNDFIVAAKLNQLSISDFLRKPKPRVL